MKKLPSICISAVILGIIFDGLFVGGRVELFFLFLLLCWVLVSFIFRLSSKSQYKIALLFLILGMFSSLRRNQVFAGSPAEIFLKYVYLFLIVGLVKEIKFD